MTWTIGDNGFGMTLSKKIPEVIAANLRPWLDDWLATKGLKVSDVKSWAIHPGGPKILDATAGSALLPSMGAPIWRQVADRPLVQKWLGSIKQLAAKEIGKPMPQLTEDLYREFHANGSRVPFESAYFERRRSLARAAIAALLDDSAERAQWLSRQVRHRSYVDDVVRALERLSTQFAIEEYGQLSYPPDRYSLIAARSRDWSNERPVALITGGVHGYETSGVHGALQFLEQRAAEYTQRINLLVVPCVSPWGYERIQGALAILGHEISDTTVANILKENGIEPAPMRRKRPSWKTFIQSHWDVLASVDFTTIEVWGLGGLVTYYLLFVMRVATRQVYFAGCTVSPDANWMRQVARNLTDGLDGFLNGTRYLLMDRDTKFCDGFRKMASR